MKLNCLDFLGISQHFSDEEIMAQKTCNEFVEKEIIPIIDEHFKNSTFPFELIENFGNLSALGQLDLSNNHLSFLPENFGNLHSLFSLNLWKALLLYTN